MILPKNLVKAIIEYLWFCVVAITLVSLLWPKPLLLFFIMLILSAVVLLQKKEKTELLVFIICSLGGGFAETVAIYFGTWSYALPQFIGVPFWLFPTWGLAAIFIKRLAELLNK